MAYITQQYAQQVSTNGSAHQKRKVAMNGRASCKATSLFFPIFVFHSTDSTKSTVEQIWGISQTMPVGMAKQQLRVEGWQAVPRYVSYASVVQSQLPPLPTK